MSIKKTIGASVALLAFVAMGVLGLIIHVWTVVLAYSVSGMFAAVISLIFPVLSELYWFGKVWKSIGIDASYCLAILGYICLFPIGLFGALVGSKE